MTLKNVVGLSGQGAAGRNFEIGVHDEEDLKDMYPEDMLDDEMMKEEMMHPQTYNIETVVYKHEHEL